MATPSHPHHRRARMFAGAAAAVVVCLGAAGCGAGQQTQTASQVAAVNGTNTAIGAIALRNVYLDVDPAAPHPVALVFTAINTSDLLPDRLVSITSAAATVTLTAPPGALHLAPGTAVAAGAPIEHPAAPAAPDRPITAAVRLDEAAAAGLTTAFTFTFARAGAITTEVPFDVVTPGEPVPAGRGALTDPV